MQRALSRMAPLVEHRATRIISAIAATLSLPQTAQAAGAEVGIMCPRLDRDSHAAFEARLRAELAVRGIDEGQLSISCGDDDARVLWIPASGRRRQHLVVMTGLASPVDALLESATALLDESPRRVRAREPMVGPVDEQPSPRDAQKPAEPWLMLDVGGGWQLWPGQGVQLIGPSIGVRLRIAPQVHAGAWGSGAWGLSVPESFSVRTITASLGLSVWLDASRTWTAEGGASAMQLRVSAGGEIAPASRSTSVVGGWVRLLAGTELGSFRLDAGPELTLWGKSHDVEFGGVESFVQPVVVPGLLLRGSYRAE